MDLEVASSCGMAGHQMPRQKRSSVDGLSGLSRIQKEIDRTRYLTMNICESMSHRDKTAI